MSLRFLIVFGTTQLYQTRRFHAIILPVNIEFSRCIGTYLSAKFELIMELAIIMNKNLYPPFEMGAEAKP